MTAARSVQAPVASAQTPSPGLASTASVVLFTINDSADTRPLEASAVSKANATTARRNSGAFHITLRFYSDEPGRVGGPTTRQTPSPPSPPSQACLASPARSGTPS